MQEQGLVFEESNHHQYRFKDIVDIETGEPLFTIEHEVRSMKSSAYMRPLGQSRSRRRTSCAIAPGHDAWISGVAYDD